MAKVDTLVVDKTGTLTEGKAELTDVVARRRMDEADAPGAGRGAGAGSEHPLAEAIVAGAEERGLERRRRRLRGGDRQGRAGTVDGKPVRSAMPR
jgi:Cu+-exporting ATPase